MLSKKLLRAGSRFHLSPSVDSDSNDVILALPLNSSFGISDVSSIIRGSGNSYGIEADNATLDTSVQKFYGSSINAGAPSGSIRLRTATGFQAFFSNNFCIEGWMYVPSIGTDNLAIFYHHAGTDAGFQLMILGSNTSYSRQLYFSGGGGGNITRGADRIPLAQWFHFACTRDSQTVRLFINGVSSLDGGGSTNANYTYSDKSNFLVSLNSTYNNVRVQDLRVYRTTAKYTSNFTPPGAMFT